MAWRGWQAANDPYQVAPQDGDVVYGYDPTRPLGQPTVIGGGNTFGGSGQSGFGADPYMADLMSFLGGMDFNAPTGLEQAAGYFSQGWENPYGTEISETLRRLLGDVSGPAFTQTEDASRRASAFTGIEANRDASLRRTKQMLGGLGHGQRSGTIVDALGRVNESSDRARAGAERDLVLEGAAKTERNRGMAAQITQMMQSIAAQNQQIQDSRMSQGASINQALAQLGLQRQNQQLQMKLLPIELQDRRLGQAMQLLGSGGGFGQNPNALLQSLMGLINQTQQSGYANDQQNAQFWGGLGGALGQQDWASLFQ